MKSFKMYTEAKLGMEATDQVFNGLRSLRSSLVQPGPARSSLFQTTRPLKPNSVGNRQTPVDHVRYFRERMALHKKWLERSQFPVGRRHLDECLAALTDAMIDLSRHQGPFTPASYHKGADPKAAEHLGQFGQFAQFLQSRIRQPVVVSPILAKASEEFDAYLDDFTHVYNRLKDSGKLPEQV